MMYVLLEYEYREAEKILERVFIRLNLLYKETEQPYKKSNISPQLCGLRNMITVAYLIVTHSQKRKENKGGFYSLDLV